MVPIHFFLQGDVPPIPLERVTMYLNWLLGYVVFSQLTICIWLLLTRGKCDDPDILATERKFDQTMRGMTGVQRLLVQCLMALAALVTAPVLLPCMMIMLVRCVVEASGEHRQLRRLVLDLLLEPIHPLNIPEELQNYFDSQTPDVESFGYQRLGDFWLKGEPINSKARIFLHPDGRAFAEIGITLGQLYVESISFFEDGSMVSTAKCDQLKHWNKFAAKGCHVQALPNCELQENVAAHLDFLDGLSQELEMPVRHISLEQWEAYYRYHCRRFDTIRFELGEIDERPVCQFPAAATDVTQ